MTTDEEHLIEANTILRDEIANLRSTSWRDRVPTTDGVVRVSYVALLVATVGVSIYAAVTEHALSPVILAVFVVGWIADRLRAIGAVDEGSADEAEDEEDDEDSEDEDDAEEGDVSGVRVDVADDSHVEEHSAEGPRAAAAAEVAR